MFRSLLFVLAVCSATCVHAAEDAWWAGLDDVVRRGGDNAEQLVQALEKVPAEQRGGLAFLMQHMPERDLTSLNSEFLLENVDYAYRARRETPWGKKVPIELFFNDVLPYVNVNETREPWRQDFYERFMPVVKDCETPAEAAQRLNEKMFKMLGVKYSTRRSRADQSPKESMETGLASCTGLSILLSDACRSVGVPARVAGIPNWVNKRGNHTWVEVWDGKWYFTGAAEPSSKGLNHVWFRKDASLAKADDPRHAIYATSFKPTGLSFPMVWARRNKEVAAVNVTQRYQITEDGNRPPTTRLLVRVYDAVGKRTAAEVSVNGRNVKPDVQGTSRNEDFDTNDILAFDLPRHSKIKVAVADGDDEQSQEIETADQEQILVDFRLSAN